jgi:hypothetical protein
MFIYLAITAPLRAAWETAGEVTSKYRAIEPVGIRYFLFAIKEIILRAFEKELFRLFLFISFVSTSKFPHSIMSKMKIGYQGKSILF